jgi:putative serine protease PepD
MPLHKFAAFAAAGLLASFGGAGIAQFVLSGDDSPAPAPAAATAPAPTTRNVSDDMTARQVYDSAHQSVAHIRSATAAGEATGSGFVVSADGLIVTNYHVVEGGEQVTVRIGTDSTDRAATVVGADPSKDLALLRVDTGGARLQPLSLADSSKVGVGDATYAIGNPYGLDDTLTTGVISALHREIQAPDGSPITDALQTDAALNPGNSGGPLFDGQGRVIGVNSQIASGGGGNVGIGFAVPSNTVRDFLANPPAPQQQEQQPQQEEPLLGLAS